jgi:HTH-type transcriptional regulator/antitoxin MqsA
VTPKNNNSCAVCGADSVTVVREPRQVTADDGVTLSFEDEFSRCQRCGVDFYTHEQSLASSRASAGVLRTHEGLLSPEEIRSIRERLSLTQAQLEQALGVGAKTVVRWERGTVRQSRVADRLLRVLAAHPAVVLQPTIYGTTLTTPPGATVQVTGFASFGFPPDMGAGTFRPMVIPQGFAIATNRIWSGVVVLSQPEEAEEELKSVLGAALTALAA